MRRLTRCECGRRKATPNRAGCEWCRLSDGRGTGEAEVIWLLRAGPHSVAEMVACLGFARQSIAEVLRDLEGAGRVRRYGEMYLLAEPMRRVVNAARERRR